MSKKGMKWEQTSNRVWRAVGVNGTFLIEQTGKMFWAHYISREKTFNMPPATKISEAKKRCEENAYWEES